MEVLLQTSHLNLCVDRARSFVRYDRTSLSFDTVAAYDTMLDALLEALRWIDRPHHVILVDLRAGPIRSGEDFESSALRFRREVFRDFARAAVLVGTQIGSLQITRHAKEQGHGPVMFRDEGEALKYLGIA
jgi:hypothetical protein